MIFRLKWDAVVAQLQLKMFHIAIWNYNNIMFESFIVIYRSIRSLSNFVQIGRRILSGRLEHYPNGISEAFPVNTSYFRR